MCAATDMNCFLAMQSAGIPGPYTPHTSYYSKDCLIKTIIGVKATGGIALEGVAKGAGYVAGRTSGFWGGLAALTEKTLGLEATLAMLPIGVVVLGDECQCNKSL